MDLKNAVALITGGARGIGKEIALAYAKCGCHLCLVDVLEKELEEAATQLRALGINILAVHADITDKEQVAFFVEKAESELGPIDILVNNAATFSVVAPVWEADPDKWFKDIRVNLYGTFLLCHEAGKRMVERKSGYILNMVSGGGVGDPHPYRTNYATSKAAAMRLTEGLAQEIGPHGVKVFAMAPPAILSEMTKFLMDDPGSKKWNPGFKGFFDRGEDSPIEIVPRLAVNLVSGRADALTGRYFDARMGFDEIMADTEAILEEDKWTLRIIREPYVPSTK